MAVTRVFKRHPCWCTLVFFVYRIIAYLLIMANEPNDALSTPVNSVRVTSSLRVPEFNASDPEMWFAVVEAYFT